MLWGANGRARVWLRTVCCSDELPLRLEKRSSNRRTRTDLGASLEKQGRSQECYPLVEPHHLLGLASSETSLELQLWESGASDAAHGSALAIELALDLRQCKAARRHLYRAQQHLCRHLEPLEHLFRERNRGAPEQPAEPLGWNPVRSLQSAWSKTGTKLSLK